MKQTLKTLTVLGLVLITMALFVSAGTQTETDTVPRNYRNGADLYSLLENQDEPYILIDVRTAEEYSQGHIPTAINIAYETIEKNLPTNDKNALIIVYCRSGRRSAIASETFARLGYTNVVDFGGVTNWPGELEH